MGKVISTLFQPVSHTHTDPTRKVRKVSNTFKEKEKHISFPPQFPVDINPHRLAMSVPVSVSLPVPVHTDKPTYFVLPDLVSHCKFELTYHVNGDEIAMQSVNWLDSGCPDLNAKQRKALRGLQAGELTAFCYNTCPPERLRVVSDFMNYLFHL